ncbi:hypothetical protein Tsp_04239 [Trichinella spiralis]|uniref:hypothetical protein n=1 Tax=Trichinella spiralis TaxID=6334 RepID=UPI0001EFBF07|nr:hypothetical protein Tsp_04239 [Trichinella spiralis]
MTPISVDHDDQCDIGSAVENDKQAHTKSTPQNGLNVNFKLIEAEVSPSTRWIISHICCSPPSSLKREKRETQIKPQQVHTIRPELDNGMVKKNAFTGPSNADDDDDDDVH